MKMLFIRHGESEDDILNLYGGWSDYPLTGKGREQVKQAANEIKSLGEKFDIILTSPLKRAEESARVLANTLGLKVETFEYVKERNTYGLLCGVEKDYAKNKYPWLVEAYERGKYVDGSEREEDVNSRAKKAHELISGIPYNSVIVVTHGNFLKAYFSSVLSRKLTRKDDAGFIMIDTADNHVIHSLGLEIE